MKTSASCLSCGKSIKGSWNLLENTVEKHNAYGRFTGVQGFLITTFDDSNEDRPGWVSAYCETCWKPAILNHEIVKTRLQEETKTLSEQNVKNQLLLTLEREKIHNRDEKIKELEKRLSEKEEEIQTALRLKCEEIQQLKNEIAAKEDKMVELTSKLDLEKQEKTELGQRFAAQEQECKTISSRNAELEEQKSNVETISEVTPSLSIQMDTLLDLNQTHGWRITSKKFEDVKFKEIITIAIIGMCDVGKSWFCNEFTGKKLFTSGFNHRTGSLDYHFPIEDGNLIGFIDTPGSNEAIRFTQEDLLEKLEAAQVKTESNVQTPNENLDSDDKAMLHYKLLKNDARILQDLKEKFIREVSDVQILICNKLSEKEQENIFKAIKYHSKLNMERARAQTSTKRKTLLYIIHNYKMLSEIEQVEKQIKRDLKDSFKVKESPLFNTEKDKFKGCNQLLYQDQFGITHLILAAKDTNAGKYYNPSTFEFLKGRVNTIEHHTSADMKNLFLEFCNRNIPIILKQDIKLQLSSDESAIVKVDGCPDAMLENLRYDEFGDFSVSAAFEPRYSVIQRQKDTNTTEVVVEVDLIHSTFTPALKRDSEGYWCLSIQGEKKIPELKQGEVNIRQDRERGSFNFMIRLLNLDKPKYKRDPEKGTKDGVVSYFFEFESGPEEFWN